jgi:hypothetical protein
MSGPGCVTPPLSPDQWRWRLTSPAGEAQKGKEVVAPNCLLDDAMNNCCTPLKRK